LQIVWLIAATLPCKSCPIGLKKITVRSILDPLSKKEMKNVTGGNGPNSLMMGGDSGGNCSVRCSPGGDSHNVSDCNRDTVEKVYGKDLSRAVCNGNNC
jgi:bacteriocin-like protein